MVKTVALVACVSDKQAEPMLAQELYRSPLFKKASQYAKAVADSWYILSAEHGLVDPRQVIAPYDKTLQRMRRQERRAWAKRVLDRLLPLLQKGDRVIFLAGEKYRGDVQEALVKAGYQVTVPMEGLTIGRQLQWLDAHNTKVPAGDETADASTARARIARQLAGEGE